jgi:hypothetical protein
MPRTLSKPVPCSLAISRPDSALADASAPRPVARARSAEHADRRLLEGLNRVGARHRQSPPGRGIRAFSQEAALAGPRLAIDEEYSTPARLGCPSHLQRDVKLAILAAHLCPRILT